MAELRIDRRALPVLALPSKRFMHRGTAEFTDAVSFSKVHP